MAEGFASCRVNEYAKTPLLLSDDPMYLCFIRFSLFILPILRDFSQIYAIFSTISNIFVLLERDLWVTYVN